MGQLRCEIIFANESYKVAEKPFLSWRHTQLSILPSKYNLYPAPTQLSVCSTAREKKRKKEKRSKKKKEKRRRNKKRERRDEGRALNDRETLCRWLFVHREAELVPRRWVPLEITPSILDDTKATPWTGLRLRISDLTSE